MFSIFARTNMYSELETKKEAQLMHCFVCVCVGPTSHMERIVGLRLGSGMNFGAFWMHLDMFWTLLVCSLCGIAALPR